MHERVNLNANPLESICQPALSGNSSGAHR